MRLEWTLFAEMSFKAIPKGQENIATQKSNKHDIN